MIVRLVMLVFGVLLMGISPASGQIKNRRRRRDLGGGSELTATKARSRLKFKSDGGSAGSVKTQKEGLVR